ncbi:hypothetical protein Syun_018027 [Stephania yunnanensis]|uniref:Uncharacterized protein n=1 Tax=Stephania yunnanensis TaxID=152371 RepID=A0AAP0IS58_9MAGN
MNFRSLDELWAFYMSQRLQTIDAALALRGDSNRSRSSSSLPSSSLGGSSSFPFSGTDSLGTPFFRGGQRPRDVRHQIWSLSCDFKMFGLMLTGRMDREIKRLGKRPVLQGIIAGDYRPCEEYESKPYAVLEAPAEAVDEVEDLSEENRKNVRENTT